VVIEQVLWRPAVSALLLERSVAHAGGVDGRRARRLARLIAELERWLPAEEARLTGGQVESRHLAEREARWQEILELYERLCLALPSQQRATR
jgi:hypothetical protein